MRNGHGTQTTEQTHIAPLSSRNDWSPDDVCVMETIPPDDVCVMETIQQKLYRSSTTREGSVSRYLCGRTRGEYLCRADIIEESQTVKNRNISQLIANLSRDSRHHVGLHQADEQVYMKAVPGYPLPPGSTGHCPNVVK